MLISPEPPGFCPEKLFRCSFHFLLLCCLQTWQLELDHRRRNWLFDMCRNSLASPAAGDQSYNAAQCRCIFLGSGWIMCFKFTCSVWWVHCVCLSYPRYWDVFAGLSMIQDCCLCIWEVFAQLHRWLPASWGLLSSQLDWRRCQPPFSFCKSSIQNANKLESWPQPVTVSIWWQQSCSPGLLDGWN